ncbi:MAG: hypothetical protein ACRDZ4_05145 [Egibacteraceae bacterium]
MFPHRQTLEARPDERDPTVARLVRADATWAYCRFPRRFRSEEQVGRRHRRLLSELLGLDEYARGYPNAWILHNPQSPDAEQAAQWSESEDPILAPYRWFLALCPWFKEQNRGAPRWHSGTDALRAVKLIASGLEACGKVATRAWMQGQEQLLAAQMNLFACRIYLDPQRAAKLARGPAPSPSRIPSYACIDLRFQEHLDRYWLYATLSVWTYKPSSAKHAPALPTQETEEGPWKVTELEDWRVYAGALRKGFKARVLEHFPPAETKILDREHRPPRFWFAQGDGLPATPDAADPISNDVKALARLVLKTPDVRGAGVAAGVINDQMLVLRRFVPDSGGELPCYLVIPFRGSAVAQEDGARWLVGTLTDLEASSAAQLFEVATDLELYAGHLRAYEAVVHQAKVLWDQLALYLPVARGSRLSRVHKLIELIHQTLLQGIADLDQVAIQANEAARKVERAASDLKDEFDRTFAERSLPDERSIGYRQSVRSSLTQAGYFDKAARQAERVRSDAAQIQRSYDTLLKGITCAFDERRVRSIDVLQRVGIVFAILVVVFGFVPEALNAVFTIWGGNKHAPGRLVALAGGTLGAMVLFLVLGTGVYLWKRYLSTLGSRGFRRRHEQVRAFLASCATDRLTRIRDAGWKRVQAALDDSRDETCEWENIIKEWDGRDRALARQCAKILDALDRDKRAQLTTDKPPRRKDLSRRVEWWALKALLVSERPRQFWRFPLLRLTFLYRFYPMMRGELQSSSIPATNEGVASDVDFNRAVSTQCRAGHAEIDQIERWAKRQLEQRKPATDFVEALDGVGLRAGMTRKRFEAMLERMRAELRQA